MKAFAMFVVLLMTFAVFPAALAEDTTNETTAAELVAEESVSEEAVVEEVVTEEAEPLLVSENEVPSETVSKGIVETVEETETTDETLIEGVIDEAEIEEAGITPDKPFLWGLERALERIDLALTFNKAAKAKKGLLHARERHLELLAMLKAKKFAAAEKAQAAYEEAIDEAESNINTDDSEVELVEATEIQSQIQEQNERMAKVKARIMNQTRLSEEQKAKVMALFDRFLTKYQNVKAKVEAKKNKIEIKIKARYELTDEEMADLKEQVKQIRTENREQISSKIKEIKEIRGEIKEVRNQTRQEVRSAIQSKIKSKVGAQENAETEEVESEE